ncbi:hypothetical protein Kfla_5897 [Kribbella flavida DSM 17836]|uniref:Esterase-like activity of phytase family protein n=1 Tax=Kribbella flavida (strain DSM 17836 / JCM 10339 / NBRC 14399) TaxID=479435 RepID=D2PRI3_KRIFD|nr:hypothetical protein [Kribbella flavida]ADB34901.1 hypothetical protein Kfla_5897 [Kribbella flavida DSM 17836]
MRLLRTVLAATAATLFSVAGAAVPAAPAAAADPQPGPKKLFTIRDPRVDESSGLARSQQYEGIWWTVNDSGDTARVFGIDDTGKVRAVLNFKAPVKDVEAIAVDRDGIIYIADIGDNKANRDMVEVYTIPEPDRLADKSNVKFHRYDFVYPDGAHDAETLLIAPRSKRLFFVTKAAKDQAGIYAAPEVASREGTNELTKVADAPGGVTDGTFLPDGDQVVLRSYVDVATMEWGEEPNVIARTPTPIAQGESVALGLSGKTVLVGSEGRNSSVFELAIPARKPAAAPATPKATPAPAAADSGEVKKNHNLRWIIVGAAVFAVIVTFLTIPPGRRERLDRMAENARLTGQQPPDPHGRRRSTA